MSNNDYMQTCNTDERTNAGKLLDLVNYLRRRTASVEELSAANAISHLLDAITTLQRQLAEANDALAHIQRVAESSRKETRRSRWIAYRAQCALKGSDDWKRIDLPKIADTQKTIADQRGEIEKLKTAITKTIEENLHLADGENCTLRHLKNAIQTA